MGSRDQGEDMAGDFVERDHFFSGSEILRSMRHTKNDASGFVLGEGASAGLAEFEQTLCAVLAHAGEEACDGFSAEQGCSGFEEEVNGWALVPNFGTLFEADDVAQASRGFGKNHVVITGCDENEAWAEGIAVAGFADFHFAEGVETFCESRGEVSWDVLDDADGRDLGR